MKVVGHVAIAPVSSTRDSAPEEPASLASVNAEVEQQFRALLPETFFVAARVLRRVLRNELEITSPLIRLPHRKTYVIERDRLLWIVARDELGVEPNAVLPARLMLIARPEEGQLARFDHPRLLRYDWRLVYHARLDFHLLDSAAPSRMSPALLRERIDRIGQTEFDEVRTVLWQESLLLHPEDLREVYAEFVAVFFELDAFAPQLLPLYFPSLRNLDAVRALLSEDCPAERLLEACTPPELQHENPSAAPVPLKTDRLFDRRMTAAAAPSERRCRARLRRASRFRERGNSVRAALWYQQAAAVAPPELARDASAGLERELDALARRLQAALELTDELTITWRRIAGALAAQATHGFWNANVRLLYDLQKVCLDRERETYRIDAWKWLRSFGRHPLKRPLPNQRSVLMSKHLSSAKRRLPAVRLAGDDREELSHLLHESAAAAERLLRRRLEPFLTHSLHDTGFVPRSVVEQVAFAKVVAELLDRIVSRGFLTLGDIRDAISRNPLKMDDLSGAGEFLAGDPLLRADQRLALLLDGVYQKGPFYLRWMQRLSSLMFGTQSGRNITMYAVLPYGSAFMAIRGAEHVVEMVRHATGQAVLRPPLEAVADASDGPPASTATADAPIDVAEEAPFAEEDSFLPDHLEHGGHATILTDDQLIAAVALLGTVIFVLMHFPQVRAGVLRVLGTVFKVFRRILYDIPLAIWRFPPVAWLMRSLPVRLFRRFLLTPIVLTVVYWKVLPWLRITTPPNEWVVLAFFSLASIVFLTRLGRDTEELFWDWLGKAWYRVRVHLIIGLFRLIVDAFRQVMDGLERLLYAVDEWLRFRAGESSVTLALKAVLGAVWSVIHAVVRFAVTLLIEPQINPIKHFPVVTVSHKLLVFMIPYLAGVLTQFLGTAWGSTIATLVITAIPGIFGFLAWELKENWKLYAANRPRKLRPALVGSHGETLYRLLAPGFHSGTIPKLFAKRRRNARASLLRPERDRQARYNEQLEHVAESVRRFFERDFLALLEHSRGFKSIPLTLSDVKLSTNRITLEIHHAQSELPLVLRISEQSGWLIAGVVHAGWAAERLEARQQRVLQAALAGIYKLSAVALVREQIESRFADSKVAYDIAAAGLVVWPLRDFNREITYNLKEQPVMNPRPRSAARAAGLAPLPQADLVFGEHELDWSAWEAYWDTEQSASALPELVEVRLLPISRHALASG